MVSSNTRKPRLGLLALLPALLLTSCGADSSRPLSAGSVVADGRVRPVAAPAIPAATTPCAYDASKLCNTDAETAGVIGGYDAALAEANRVICYARTVMGLSPCPAPEGVAARQ